MAELRTTQRRRRSYWQSCVSDTERAREAIRSWFAPMSDGMTPYKSEILCDLETDAEKKLRAFMTDEQGQHFVSTRSRGKRDTIISWMPYAGARCSADTPYAPRRAAEEAIQPLTQRSEHRPKP